MVGDRLLYVVSASLLVATVAAAYLGAVNIGTAAEQREETAKVEQDTANLRLVIEALDAD